MSDGSFRNFNSKREHNREGQPFDDSHLRLRGYAVTIFDYELPDSTLLYQQNRYDQTENLLPGVDAGEKKFLPSRPVRVELFDRKNNIGDRVFGPGNRRVIFNWPAIVKAGPGSTVFVCEGETNATDLNKAGLLATTVISHKWTDECVAALTGYDLIILEDHDDDGRKLTAKTYSLLSKVAKSARIVPYLHLRKHLNLDPERAKKDPAPNSDVSDWIRAGGDPAKLIEICREVPADGEITANPHDFPAEASIPLWDWLYGIHLLRGTVSGTAALGGSGKTSLSIGEALAQATGKPLYGTQAPRPLRVLLINLEDNRNAMDKRIAATMKHHGLKAEDVGNRLFVKAKGELAFKIAKQVRSGSVERNEQFINGLIAFLTENKIDVLDIDPFVSTHGVNENDNSAIREVVDCYSDIAEAAKCAIHLWHHTRKANSQAATVDSARGASSFVDACRSVRVLETMTKEEGQKLKIERPGYYFRAFNGKLNFAPPTDKSDWFKFVSVTLDNAGALFGDDVGVIEAWLHPGTKEVDLTEGTINAIKKAVGPEPRWRDYATSDMWVGKAIASILGLDHEDDATVVKATIKKLKKMGGLKEVSAKDAMRRDKIFVIAVEQAAPGSGPQNLNDGQE